MRLHLAECWVSGELSLDPLNESGISGKDFIFGMGYVNWLSIRYGVIMLIWAVDWGQLKYGYEDLGLMFSNAKKYYNYLYTKCIQVTFNGWQCIVSFK